MNGCRHEELNQRGCRHCNEHSHDIIAHLLAERDRLQAEVGRYETAIREWRKAARELQHGSDVGVNPSWLIDRCTEALASALTPSEAKR